LRMRVLKKVGRAEVGLELYFNRGGDTGGARGALAPPLSF